MPTTLEWLGGTEEVVSRMRIVELLCGVWLDSTGSVYTLTRGHQFALDVLTARPHGARRFTPALVQCAARDSGVALLWGRSAHKYEGSLEGSRLTWRRAGSTDFRWEKLQ